MIFVTVGTQLPFDRLLRSVDAWAAVNPGIRVHAQTGRIPPGGYQPKHMQTCPNLIPEEFDRLCLDARLIVAHAGTGTMLKAAALRKKLLVMPRRAALGEHRNDHQVATADQFRDRPGIHVVDEEHQVSAAIDALLNTATPPPDLPPQADQTLIATLRRTIFPEA